ncbi:AraC family transcriptional regulator [Actinocorallia sp. A-T 12471]|uniref:AraC family transcriptional regulator n=1 Tax=Actinocorallia sp. A-T 12471 TaxID=3089813 RepID=UPI0029D0D5F1|nr:AraC family transcriptional regulator [Actinocorallia sp. A-T 12471]MDX6741615.1 AraC family transcriptional regulator [Actinocorallia sp. A-T 12471]
MQSEIEMAVLRAIEAMQERLGDELKIDDMARAALFSKFHFSRVFQRVTGLSPGRFLSAMRLEEAKRLLSETPYPVTEISVRVGYSSVGTFSSRFKSSVGVSPTDYRRRLRFAPVPAKQPALVGAGARASVSGTVESEPTDRPVFAGLFPGPIQQGGPVRCAVLDRPGPFVLRDVPLGSWYLMAQAETATGVQHIGSTGPLTVRPGTTTLRADVRLRPRHRFDPPVLLALQDLRALAERFAA